MVPEHRDIVDEHLKVPAPHLSSVSSSMPTPFLPTTSDFMLRQIAVLPSMRRGPNGPEGHVEEILQRNFKMS